MEWGPLGVDKPDLVYPSISCENGFFHVDDLIDLKGGLGLGVSSPNAGFGGSDKQIFAGIVGFFEKKSAQSESYLGPLIPGILGQKSLGGKLNIQAASKTAHEDWVN